MYSFKAKVIKGKGRGRRIGFPTINLNKEKLDIDCGVYLVKVIYDSKDYKGLLHFGPKETFNENISTEIYINNFNLDIYNKFVKIEVVERIRGVKKFNNAEELKKQISKDLNYL